MATIPEALAVALQHHQAGRLPAAEQLYRQILQVDPNQADAAHLLGVMAHQLGKLEIAAEYMRRAIGLRPGDGELHHSLGKVYHSSGRLGEAEACYRAAIHANPALAGAHDNLGTALRDQGKLDEAIAAYRRAVELGPALAEAHNNLGLVLKVQGKLAESAACCRRALALKPDLAAAHNNLGLILGEQGRPEEALACFRRGVELDPGSAEAHNNLAVAWKELGKLEEAEACCRRALALQPGSAAAHNSLGNILLGQARLAEAAAAFQRAIELDPGFAFAHNNLGNALSASGQAEAAIASFETALRFQPSLATAHSNLLATLHYCPKVTLASLAEAHAAFDRQHAAPLGRAAFQHSNERDPERPLRLGFISPHFAEHPVGRFLIRPLESIDRRGFELWCYSDTTAKDAMTARMRSAVDEWRDVSSISDEDLARQIGDDRIDLLFDLAGHTPGNRLGVFARKPAPVQISWLDYVGTTGLEAIDYLIADPREVPVEAARWYREKILEMPDDYICFDPPPDAPPVGPLPALARRGVTFGSFNIAAKLNPQVVAVWARVLHAVPGSRLLLKNWAWGDARTCERFRSLFLQHGIPAERLEMRGWSPSAEVMSAYHEVDLALDPFPYNGGLTTCEALWMGVPVVTCPGQTFAGRHGLAHLSTVGFTETIAADLDAYVATAVALARDLPRLGALRAGLRDRVARSPLCDGPRFAANFGRLVRGAWRSWVESSSR